MTPRMRSTAALAIVLLSCQAIAQIPLTLSYQGILTDAAGKTIADGTITLRFALYDVPTGGTALWQESQAVTVAGGLFSTLLGTATPLDLPFDKPYWVGVSVGQDEELLPRVALAASPYSLNARATTAEPGNGQGITIRTLSGVVSHSMHPDGSSFHAGKTTLASRLELALGQADTALRIGTAGSPSFLFLVGQNLPGRSQNRANNLADPGEAKPARTSDEFLNGDLQVLGGNVEIVDGVTQEPASAMGLDGISTTGTLAVVRGANDTVIAFRPDGTSYHRGLEIFEGGISITGTGKGVRFPDGSFQATAVSPGPPFDGILQGKALVVKNASGVEVFRVDTTGASLHKGDETFEGDVILKGQGGKGAKLVDGNGETIAGFGRVDLDTDQRIGVYGRAEGPNDLAGAFEGDVEVNGEIYVSSLHVVRGAGDTVVHFNADGTSEHWGLETYREGLQTVLSNGNTLRLDPAEGLTLKTAGGQFRGHMDPNGNGYFAGNLGVAGTLSKASGSFKIDHPLDPANKYLYHSFVESPDMKNIYDGVAVLDGEGKATVTLPAWFEALNKDFRYQLTPIGAPAPNLHVSRKIAGNQFSFAGGEPGVEVSWQITGVREDAYAEKHRIPVEEQKPLADQGRYLHPDAFDLPEGMGISLARKEVEK